MILKYVLKISIFSLLPLLFLSINSSHAFTKDVYQLPNDLKLIFWKRYNSWYLSHFKTNQAILKVGKSKLPDQNTLSPVGFQQVFNKDRMQSVVIKGIFLKSNPQIMSGYKCNLVFKFPEGIDQHCGDDSKSWQKAICPQTLRIKGHFFRFSTMDSCFSLGDETMVVSSEVRESFYSKTWPRVYNVLSKEFGYYPKGIIWNKEKKVKLYYW